MAKAVFEVVTVLRFLSSALAIVALQGVARGTDLPPSVTPSPQLLSPTPIAFNWSGFYFGGHGGWGFASGDFADGAVIGGQVGVNWQYGGFVVGFEGGASFADFGSINSVTTGLVRGGYAFDRFLVYGAAGLGVEELKTLVGWVAGGGVEYAILNNWTVGIEYLHYDFADDESEVIRGRVNYLFGDANALYGDGIENGGIFDEVRLGGFAFLPGDVASEDGVYVTGQVLLDPFVRPFDNWFLDSFLRPRPHLGGTASPNGTDQVFAGLTWTFPFGRYVFAEGSFGGTVHNGPIIGPDWSLGCHALFRESAGVGANIGAHWRVIASVDHSSHANLCSDENDGLTHVGGSIGYRF
jgi:opacity protein-like surface antigen